MAPDRADNPTASPAGVETPWSLRGGSYSDYGVALNSLTVDKLFEAYRKHNFIYPAKAARLSRYLRVIQQNWERALNSDGELLWFATHSDRSTESWASIASWKSTNDGWLTQHLVSSGSPAGSLAVMLSSLVVRYLQHTDRSHQNWFQPRKKYPRRVFGTIEAALGGELASVRSYRYLALDMNADLPGPTDKSIHVLDVTKDRDMMKAVSRLAREQRGEVYVQAEQLDSEDIELSQLDEVYRKSGLRRYRRVFAAFRLNEDAPFFAAIMWRGPLGMNFSFLENRCDILANDARSAELGLAAIWPQLAAAYADFEPSFIPLVFAYEHGNGALSRGAREICEYSQSIWLRESFPAWYNHVANLFPRFYPPRSTLTDNGLGNHDAPIAKVKT